MLVLSILVGVLFSCVAYLWSALMNHKKVILKIKKLFDDAINDVYDYMEKNKKIHEHTLTLIKLISNQNEEKDVCNKNNTKKGKKVLSNKKKM